MICILMPIYNGIEFINESVNSIINQTCQSWELIIGVNGHSENSSVYQTAKKFENEKVKVLDLWNIKGKVPALHEMLKYTNKEWIALLDVDDYWLPQKLEEQIPFMHSYDVIGTRCQYFGNSNIIPDIPIENITNYNFFITNPIINSSVLFRKKLCVWENTILEDYDLWLKLRKLNYNFYNVPTILVMHRIHSNSAFNAQGNHLKLNELLKNHSNSVIIL